MAKFLSDIYQTITFSFSVAKSIIAKCLKNKDPINKDNMDGITPLHLAAERGSLELCQLIMAHIEYKNPMDRFGQTPEDLAYRSGHLAIAKLFADNPKGYMCIICGTRFSLKDHMRQHMHQVHVN